MVIAGDGLIAARSSGCVFLSCDILDEISVAEVVQPRKHALIELARGRQAVVLLVNEKGAFGIVAPAAVDFARRIAMIIQEDLKFQNIHVVAAVAGKVDLPIERSDASGGGGFGRDRIRRA